MKITRIVRLSRSSSGVNPYTPEEALAYVIKCRLTKDAYIETRLGTKKTGADIYPAYELIKAAKQECYPDRITVTAVLVSTKM